MAEFLLQQFVSLQKAWFSLKRMLVRGGFTHCTSFKILFNFNIMKQPINPDFIEHLEELIATGRTCVIKFWGDNGAPVATSAKLANLYSDSGSDFVRTREGLVIELHRLIEVEGRPLHFLA